jgi:hypothetical protein
MASALYKTCLIVSAADCDRDTQEWRPWVSVCWRDDSRQHVHRIRFAQEIFKNAQEATTFGMKAGEMWIDERLRSIRVVQPDGGRMEPNSTCNICGGTMKVDANTKPQLRCDKCGHQEVAAVGAKTWPSPIIKKTGPSAVRG